MATSGFGANNTGFGAANNTIGGTPTFGTTSVTPEFETGFEGTGIGAFGQTNTFGGFGAAAKTTAPSLFTGFGRQRAHNRDLEHLALD